MPNFGPMGMGFSIHIMQGEKSGQGFPYDDAEGIEAPTNHHHLYQRERHMTSCCMDERTGAEIYGRELKEDRGYIQVPGQGPYFPHFY